MLERLRNGETETSIAKNLRVSRETIVRDVRWLKNNILYDFTLITNEIMQELRNRVTSMKDTDLISFLAKLIPQKIEKREEVFKREEIVTVDVSENEDEILSKAAAILTRKRESAKIH